MNGIVGKTVTIEVGFDGSNFTYIDRTIGASGKLKVERSDTVTWRCALPAALVFDPATPFRRMHYWATGPGGSFVDALGNPPGPFTGPGRFKYYVAVLFDNRIYIDDPEVIVEY
jgi:hypothetical protein